MKGDALDSSPKDMSPASRPLLSSPQEQRLPVMCKLALTPAVFLVPCFVCLGGLPKPGQISKPQLQLSMMTDKGLKGRGAVCLDGSDAGFYFAPSSTGAKAWHIFFNGGGWCYDEADCLARSSTFLGSSKTWAQNISIEGMLSSDCEANPDFCNFNRVVLNYCDGMSFAGDRTDPVMVAAPNETEAKPLYFRGRRILDAVLDTLLEKGLAEAEEVLLTGCSAGGLAAILHADHVKKRLDIVPRLKKFGVAPISGFFLLHSNLDGEAVFPEEMKYAFDLANASYGVNADCVAAFPEETWKCGFAQHSFAFTHSRVFLLNSALDSWQISCIYTAGFERGFPREGVQDMNGNCSAAPGWKKCSKDVASCGAEQVHKLNEYIQDFQAILAMNPSTSRGGNGAFIHSCFTHCEALSNPQWSGFEINGVSMQQAVSKWWQSNADPSSHHTYSPCLYRSSPDHTCNPSCLPPVEQSMVV